MVHVLSVDFSISFLHTYKAQVASFFGIESIVVLVCIVLDWIFSKFLHLCVSCPVLIADELKYSFTELIYVILLILIWYGTI